MEPLIWFSGLGSVAARYGYEEAGLLENIMFWVRTNKAEKRNFFDGRWWTYNSAKGMAEIFPWWTPKQIRRLLNSCIDQGALVSANYNQDGRDRTLWYSPSDELLALYGEHWGGESICPNGKMQVSKQASAGDQTGRPLPCNNHVLYPPYSPPNHSAADLQDEPDPKPKPRKRRDKTVPVHKPDRFEKFWALYPGGGSRQRAAEAWDKLAPDDDLIAQMGAALQRQMDSPMWRKGVGIPYASTWLNGRRWTDKLPPGQGGAPQDHGNDPSGGPKVPVYVRTEIDPVTGEERDVYE